VTATNSENGTFNGMGRRKQPHASRLRVLVVDDHETVVQALARALSKYFEIVTAYNGDQAFGLIATMSFDAAVVDHDLPDTTGPEILKRLHERTPLALRVLISGHQIPGIEFLRSSGIVHRFFLKPVDVREIRRLIQS
jgi:response regulator RpfG family c-di-GMP phosphodiesterase